VGVAPQYCSTLGKIANCQTLVSLTLARHEVPIMLALRLFLRWSRFLRQAVKVDLMTKRMIHHEDTQAVHG